MTIHFPEDLESSIRAAVHSGRFASEDDMVATAVREFLRRSLAEASPAPVASSSQPVWEDILELTADVPDEEWDKLPTDLAEQHDHYIYGTPKRPTS
jgi:Arc/MetJ-type ribon-helix-helix transcriptional regulator